MGDKDGLKAAVQCEPRPRKHVTPETRKRLMTPETFGRVGVPLAHPLPQCVGYSDEGTASFAIDAVRVLTASHALGSSTVGFGYHGGRLGGIQQ